MSTYRDQYQREADERALRDYEPASSEPTPFDEPVVKTPCENCPTLCKGRLCRSCLPSGPDDRRVRSSK